MRRIQADINASTTIDTHDLTFLVASKLEKCIFPVNRWISLVNKRDRTNEYYHSLGTASSERSLAKALENGQQINQRTNKE